MADITLTCRECREDFIFTESEQEFYKEKGYANQPQRCPNCRAAKKQHSGDNKGGYGNNRGGYGDTQREMYPVVCAGCGKETTVPFKPSADRPVYCRDCYKPRNRY